MPKRAELTVQAAFDGIPFAGVETGDLSRNRWSVQEFEDTDAFVAFLDIEPMYELGDDDGVAIALGYLDVVEVGPLAGELVLNGNRGIKLHEKAD